MGNLQKKCRTTGKKSVAYRGKSGQNTGTDFPALRLGVVLYLLSIDCWHQELIDQDALRGYLIGQTESQTLILAEDRRFAYSPSFLEKRHCEENR